MRDYIQSRCHDSAHSMKITMNSVEEVIMKNNILHPRRKILIAISFQLPKNAEPCLN